MMEEEYWEAEQAEETVGNNEESSPVEDEALSPSPDNQRSDDQRQDGQQSSQPAHSPGKAFSVEGGSSADGAHPGDGNASQNASQGEGEGGEEAEDMEDDENNHDSQSSPDRRPKSSGGRKKWFEPGELEKGLDVMEWGSWSDDEKLKDTIAKLRDPQAQEIVLIDELEPLVDTQPFLVVENPNEKLNAVEIAVDSVLDNPWVEPVEVNYKDFNLMSAPDGISCRPINPEHVEAILENEWDKRNMEIDAYMEDEDVDKLMDGVPEDGPQRKEKMLQNIVDKKIPLYVLSGNHRREASRRLPGSKALGTLRIVRKNTKTNMLIYGYYRNKKLASRMNETWDCLGPAAALIVEAAKAWVREGKSFVGSNDLQATIVAAVQRGQDEEIREALRPVLKMATPFGKGPVVTSLISLLPYNLVSKCRDKTKPGYTVNMHWNNNLSWLYQVLPRPAMEQTLLVTFLHKLDLPLKDSFPIDTQYKWSLYQRRQGGTSAHELRDMFNRPPKECRDRAAVIRDDGNRAILTARRCLILKSRMPWRTLRLIHDLRGEEKRDKVMIEEIVTIRAVMVHETQKEIVRQRMMMEKKKTKEDEEENLAEKHQKNLDVLCDYLIELKCMHPQDPRIIYKFSTWGYNFDEKVWQTKAHDFSGYDASSVLVAEDFVKDSQVDKPTNKAVENGSGDAPPVPKPTRNDNKKKEKGKSDGAAAAAGGIPTINSDGAAAAASGIPTTGKPPGKNQNRSDGQEPVVPKSTAESDQSKKLDSPVPEVERAFEVAMHRQLNKIKKSRGASQKKKRMTEIVKEAYEGSSTNTESTTTMSREESSELAHKRLKIVMKGMDIPHVTLPAIPVESLLVHTEAVIDFCGTIGIKVPKEMLTSLPRGIRVPVEAVFREVITIDDDDSSDSEEKSEASSTHHRLRRRRRNTSPAETINEGRNARTRPTTGSVRPSTSSSTSLSTNVKKPAETEKERPSKSKRKRESPAGNTDESVAADHSPPPPPSPPSKAAKRKKRESESVGVGVVVVDEPPGPRRTRSSAKATPVQVEPSKTKTPVQEVEEPAESPRVTRTRSQNPPKVVDVVAKPKRGPGRPKKNK